MSSAIAAAARAIRLVELRRQCLDGEAREIRSVAGLSLAEVGDGVGVAAPTVWKWERGLRTPRGDAALRYAVLLDHLGGSA